MHCSSAFSTYLFGLKLLDLLGLFILYTSSFFLSIFCSEISVCCFLNISLYFSAFFLQSIAEDWSSIYIIWAIFLFAETWSKKLTLCLLFVLDISYPYESSLLDNESKVLFLDKISGVNFNFIGTIFILFLKSFIFCFCSCLFVIVYIRFI